MAVIALVICQLTVVVPAASAAQCTGNKIVCENQLAGTPQSEWDNQYGAGDDTIQGFATQISANLGETVQFKIKTDASNYQIVIYRLGYYQGNGAREIARLSPSAALPQNQPACATDPSTEIYDCGTWAVSASWTVPSTAVSGVYIARLIRSDTGGESQIPFIIRDDTSHADVVFQTSDTTWQAYNAYGGSSFYRGLANGRAYKLSYNRPFDTRGGVDGRDFLFSNEYPTIRFLEQNGYDVTYISGLDTDIRGNQLTNHKAFLSVGHDEYWSAQQRTNVENARDSGVGVNLAFLSGNEVYWKTRWESSQDGSNTPNRTLVCYKDTWADTQIDPLGPTATWRDPRFGDNGHGPENGLTGTAYVSNSVDYPITVNSSEGKLRLWRNTSLTNLPTGSTAQLAPHTVGYEADEDLDNGFRPAGLFHLSTTQGAIQERLQDFGNTVAPGTINHHLTMYRASSGALVFGAGTVQWAWGLDANHDGGTGAPADVRMRQATLNLLADMGVTASTRASDLVAATKSTDTSPPTTVVTSPAANSTIQHGSQVTVTGTSSDVSGRVAGVEVSLDAGATWHPATGTTSFSYTGILVGQGSSAIMVRAVDDSANLESPKSVALDVRCPCSIFGNATPVQVDAGDSSSVTLGTKFKANANGFIVGIRFYKSNLNTGTHVGTLYNDQGAALASGTFANESQSGWQTLTFQSAIPVTAGTTYTAAYFAPAGHYSADQQFFASLGLNGGRLSALGGASAKNGVYSFGNSVPTQSWRATNYYVDALYSEADTTPLTVTSVSPVDGSSSVGPTVPITAKFSRAVDTSSVSMVVRDANNAVIPGTTTYDSASQQAQFTPTSVLPRDQGFTVSVNAAAPGVGAMAAPFTWSFRTAWADQQDGACPCTLFNDSSSPPNASARGNNASVELGVAFTVDSPGVISGVRFYKDQGNTGQHGVSLWSADGSLLATAAVPNETTVGWQEGKFATPVSVLPGNLYVASYLAPSGGYQAEAGGLSQPIVRWPLRTPSDAGRYSYPSGYPGAKSGANYFVDPIFGSPPDTPPQVSALDPADTSSSVPTSSTIGVQFSMAIQPGSAQVVVSTNGTNVQGTNSQSSPGAPLVFTPSSTLAPATQYQVTVSGAKSLSGIPMAAAWTGQFTTSGLAVCPCTLMPSLSQPASADGGDPNAITVGVRFTPTTDGFISGIRYFRSAANTGQHTGGLYNSAGVKLADVTFNDQGTGWQTGSLSKQVAVTAGATYVAGVYMPNGHYSASPAFFNSEYRNEPLVGIAGVYVYGSNQMPTASYNGTNYSVDVVFTTQDVSGPEVTASTPAQDATVDVSSVATATFARAIDPSTLQFNVNGSAGNITGTVNYDPNTRTASFTPTSPLAYATQYTVSLTASSAAGVPMAEPASWSFRTAAGAPTGPQTLFDDASTPQYSSFGDNQSVALGVKFKADFNGQISAVRFYAGDGNTGSTVSVWSAQGALLGSGVTSDTGATGWRTVQLSSPVPITAGQQYVASYVAPAGRYAVTVNGLAQGIDRGPFHIAAGGGSYQYGSSYPGQPANHNYWVDVIGSFS